MNDLSVEMHKIIMELSNKILNEFSRALNGMEMKNAILIYMFTLSIMNLKILNSQGILLNEEVIDAFLVDLKDHMLSTIEVNNLDGKSKNV